MIITVRVDIAQPEMQKAALASTFDAGKSLNCAEMPGASSVIVSHYEMFYEGPCPTLADCQLYP